MCFAVEMMPVTTTVEPTCFQVSSSLCMASTSSCRKSINFPSGFADRVSVWIDSRSLSTSFWVDSRSLRRPASEMPESRSLREGRRGTLAVGLHANFKHNLSHLLSRLPFVVEVVPSTPSALIISAGLIPRAPPRPWFPVPQSKKCGG